MNRDRISVADRFYRTEEKIVTGLDLVNLGPECGRNSRFFCGSVKKAEQIAPMFKYLATPEEILLKLWQTEDRKRETEASAIPASVQCPTPHFGKLISFRVCQAPTLIWLGIDIL
ncbi:uncharacterized protein H6S33_000210 [Morchella sextelata]|jgi:hypothetical protein|uniref:uncharacterized protein n=1 Tax=Morchella sextelata TaxID=1174677 RepID=UPI001D04DC14|nr:uncharacterized protein H6S33_000210 [Morchella sextelata]KAH0614574.1 hypothetical protein H6S33_000210 [Morchella sextelata]